MSFDWKEGGKMKALFLALLVLGSVVVFALGVMVGTNLKLPDSGLRQAANAPAPAATEGRQVVPLQPKGTQVKGEDMSFYNTLPEATRRETTPPPKASQPAPSVGQAVTQPAEPGAASQVVAQITAAKPAPPAGNSAPVAAEPAKPQPPAKAEPVKAEPATAAAPKAEPVVQAKAAPVAPPAAPPKTAGGRFSVQVLSTSSRAEAEKAEEEMGKLGLPAVITSKGKGKFVVRVSQTDVEADARKALATVVKQSRFKDAWLVKP
jgi:hypothetical protein